MPHPKKGETKREFISRAIKFFMQREGKDKDQAIAMAHAFWDRYK